jgi:hypothetical protein
MNDPEAVLSAAGLRRLAELAERLRDDSLADSDVAELESLLAESPAAHQAFAELALLATELCYLQGSFAAPLPRPAPRRFTPAWLRDHWRPLALAAGFTLVAWLGWTQFPPRSTASGPPVATLSNASGTALYASDRPVKIAMGSTLAAGPLHLRRGLLELTYPSGVVLVVEAPARFDLRTATTLWLGEGNISARVPKGAQGFVIETASARIVDLGTEFAVSAMTVSSEVHVFKGEVLVTNASEPDSLRLTENRASRIDTQTRTPTGIACEPERFIRSFDEPASSFPRLINQLDPVAYYRMRITPESSRLVDVSSHQRHGEIVAGASQRTFVPGKRGAGLRFGGPAAPSFARVRDFPPAPAAELTVCAWVRADSRPRWASIAKHWARDSGRSKGGQFHFGLWHDEGSLEVHVQDAAGREVGVREATPLPLGEWQFVAFTHDGTTLRLYRNGREVASAPCAGLSPAAPDALGIGVKLDRGHAPEQNTPGFWDGVIDELAVFHHALAAEQVLALYESEP